MAFCRNCGADIGDSEYCPSCGTPIDDSSEAATRKTFKFGKVNIRRPSSVNVVTDPIYVSIDGENVGSLKNGEECSVDLPYGIHTLRVSSLMNNPITSQVLLDEQHTTSDWITKFGMTGLVLEQGILSHTDLEAVENIEYKSRSPYIVILAGIALVIAIFVIIMVRLNSPKNSSQNSANNKGTNTSANTTQAIPSFTRKKGTLNNWEIIINDFEYKKTISTGLITGYTAEEGSQYCIISLTVKNIGKKSDVFLPSFVIGDETEAMIIWGDYTFRRTEMLDLVLSGDSITNNTMNPLVTSTGQIVFELPNEVVSSKIIPIFIIKAGDNYIGCELKKE